MSISIIKEAYLNLYLQKNVVVHDFLYSQILIPYIEDFNRGWVGTGNGVWNYEKPNNTYTDIYSVLAGHQYFLTLGDNVGTRFRVMFSTIDVSIVTSGKVTGTAVNTTNYDNPAPYQNLYYTPAENGYLIIQKDNVGTSGIKTYLYDFTVPRVFCYPLGKLDPDNYDNSKIMQIVNSILPCLDDAIQLVAVKIFEGYNIIVN